MQIKKQWLEPDMEQQTGSKLRKEYVKAVYCHLACLTYMQSQFNSVQFSRSVVSDPQRLHGLQPSRLLCPRDFPGKSTGVGCHCLLRLCRIHHVKCQMDESQAGIKISWRNSNNLRYADDTTVMAESKEELRDP